MPTEKRNPLIQRAVAVLMSCLLVISALMSFAAGGGKAHAAPGPYTPIPEVAPEYEGALTWMDYTPPLTPISITEAVYVPFFLDFDGQDNLYMTAINLSIGSDTSNTATSKIVKISSDDQTVTNITYNYDMGVAIGIDVDANGNVYVAENSEFGDESSSGNEVRILMLPHGSSLWKDITYDASMHYATGIAADREGNVYAIDSTLDGGDSSTPPRILKLSQGGEHWQDIAESVFEHPIDIAVDGEGNVFVSDLAEGIGGEIRKLPYLDDEWTNVTPAGIPFMTYGLGVDQYDNLFAMNLMSGNVMKLGHDDGPGDWQVVEVTTSHDTISYDVAADSSGYLHRTSMASYNVKKLMAAVQYNGNGAPVGSAPVDAVGYEPNIAATVLGNTGGLAKPGHTFEGWNTKSDGMGTAYAPGDAINMTHSVTLYAVWSPIPVITLTGITLDSAGYSLTTGATHQTVTTAVYSDHSTRALTSGVTYSSSNAAVATVNGTGLVTAVASGQTVITAEYAGEQAQATVTVTAPSSDDSGTGTTGASADPGVEIIVDGVKQDQLAKAERNTVDGRTVVTVTLDSRKVIDKMARDNNKLLTIPLAGNDQVVIGKLTGSLVKALESNDARIQIVTDRAAYTLPASQINIDGISAQIGTGVKLEDVTVQIQISVTSEARTAVAQAAAERNRFEMVVHPVDFEVSASYGSRTVQADAFNSYVGRMIALPEGMNTEDVTTGVVLTADGELFHVPTVVVRQNGIAYALINSLTNSTYSVIHNPQEMDDVKGHWAEDDVNDMSSRLVIRGVTATQFRPDASITRAEFAAIVTRALGIQDAKHASTFTDVGETSWYAGAVQAAVRYELLSGYPNGTFRPDQRISRQEAAVVLARAAAIANLGSELSAEEAARILSAFKDGGETADWARKSVAFIAGHALMKGRDAALDLQADLTRAETASLLRRLLQAGTLINS